MAIIEELGLVPRRSKRLRTQNPPPLSDASSSSSSPSSFMSDVEEELLLEILLRLPHALSAVQCGLVCKRWSSLIFTDYFRTRFNQRQRHSHSRYLDPSYSLPFTLLFRFFRRKSSDITFTSHALSSNAPPGIRHYSKSTSYLDFLPGRWPFSRIETSSHDLLLSSFFDFPMKYCVSNPLTRQYNILPRDMPPLRSCGRSGLWLDPNQYGSDKCLGNYKVVVLDIDNAFVVAGDNYMFRALQFCSETGKWSQRNFTAPRAFALAESETLLNEAVGSGGVLYFPLTVECWKLTGFLALDSLASGECRLINVPDGFRHGWRAELFFRVGVGVVRGRLRVWQLLKNNGGIDLKVWELRDDEAVAVAVAGTAAWVLVHDVSVKRDKRKTISVVAFDPNDGDIVFMVLNNCICKYNIREDKYEKVGQIPNFKRTRAQREYVLWNFIDVYSVLHTSWPVLPM